MKYILEIPDDEAAFITEVIRRLAPTAKLTLLDEDPPLTLGSSAVQPVPSSMKLDIELEFPADEAAAVVQWLQSLPSSISVRILNR